MMLLDYLLEYFQTAKCFQFYHQSLQMKLFVSIAEKWLKMMMHII
jgi:hypothetical protein